MTAQVLGLGWVTAAGLGTGRGAKPFVWSEGELPRLTGRTVFPEGHPRFGRMDRLSKIGLAAIAATVRDAEACGFVAKGRTGIIVGTGQGCRETDRAYYDTVIPEEGRFASPNLFAYTLPTSLLGEAALHFGLTGPTYVLYPAAGDELAGLEHALDELACGGAEAMLVGWCDTISNPVGLPAGAVFLLLGKEERHEGYGVLSHQPKGGWRFDGRLVKGWRDLLEQGQAVTRGLKGAD